MKIICPHCNKKYNIDDDKLRTHQQNTSVPCPSCKGDIPIKQPTGIKTAAGLKAEFLSGQELKDQILASLKELPAMPQVAQKARSILGDPNSHIGDLAKVIETDQSISASVLKLANSAHYGISGKVSSVQHASVVLGLETLMELVTLACSSGLMANRLSGYELESGDFWQHSLAVASAGRAIALKVSPKLEHDAFSAGLLHDVGKLILDPYILERKELFDTFVKGGEESFLKAEKDILGFDHAELAADVCTKWQIPSTISTALCFHHEPSGAKGDLLANIIHAADSVALMSGIGTGLDGLLYQLDEDAMALLKLNEMDLPIIMSDAVEYVNSTADQL